jgi:hypothetical protein
MKTFTFIIKFIATIIVIGLLTFYFVQRTTLKNLEERKNNVTSLWEKFDSKLNNRDKLILSLNLKNTDSLKYLIDKSKLGRKNKVKLLEFEFNEYKLNKFVLNNQPNKGTETESLYQELNEITTEYNSIVKDFNVYYSTFPNFIFAKRNGYKREKFLTIEYGKENQDPIEKSKEIPEWAKNVDTTFLRK